MTTSTAFEKDSEPIKGFTRILKGETMKDPLPHKKENARFEVNPEQVKNGLGQLVLTLVKLLHELLERQALRRIDSESLSNTQIEAVGQALMQQADEIERLRKEFNLEDEDLNLDLGPLGKLI